MNRAYSALLPALLAGLAVSQDPVVVPASFADAEAPGAFGVPGIGGTERVQVLIDPVHLGALVGAQITGVQFRRNAEWGDALAAAQGQLVVRLGAGAAAASQARPDFAANLPQPAEVYRGAVTAPSAAAVGGYVGWVDPHVVTVNFTTPFLYTGGTLCVDLEGVGSAGDWWPVDGTEDRNAGRFWSVGQACGPRAAVLGETAGVSAADLVVGETVHLGFFGEPRSMALAMFGADTLSQPLDLSGIGAPGCSLHVMPFATAPVALTDALAGAPFGGLGQFLLHLPGDPGLLGARFAVQWLEFLGLGLATSNALLCEISSQSPGTGIATVWSRPGGAPVVDFTSAPVVRLLR